MEKSKNSEQKINNQNYNNQQNKIIQNECENEKEEDNEIIIELEISNNEKEKEKEKEKEINILCDKDQLIKDNKKREIFNINPPKEFNYLNKDNTKLYLNDKEIEFNHKIKINKNETNKIKINQI